MTHELKTPLVNFELVRQIINRQVEHLDPAQIKELLGSLNAGSDRLTHVVDQMVYMTQIDTTSLSADKLRTDGMPVEIGMLLTGAIALGRRFAVSHKNMSIQVDGASAIVPAGHLPSLKHALAEIISNALNYSPDGAQVEITMRRTRGVLTITIADHGAGMSPEQQRKALIPFEQIDREQQGLGLGLPLAKQIVEIHGGTFDIHSEPEQGTRITIQFPISIDTQR